MEDASALVSSLEQFCVISFEGHAQRMAKSFFEKALLWQTYNLYAVFILETVHSSVLVVYRCVVMWYFTVRLWYNSGGVWC